MNSLFVAWRPGTPDQAGWRPVGRLDRRDSQVADQLEQTGVPRRRGAVASVAALVRWFFDGSAVPLKLAAVTAAVATAATLAVAPTIRSYGNEPVRVIPTVVTPGARAKIPAPVRTVGHANRQAPGRSIGARARASNSVSASYESSWRTPLM